MTSMKSLLAPTRENCPLDTQIAEMRTKDKVMRTTMETEGETSQLSKGS